MSQKSDSNLDQKPPVPEHRKILVINVGANRLNGGKEG